MKRQPHSSSGRRCRARLEVIQEDGRRFTVTVDGAALLATLTDAVRC